MRRLLARVTLRLLRLRFVPPSEPLPARSVLVAAPHTSWLDLPLALSLTAMNGLHVRWLGKSELFRGPGGYVLRALGGIPVDREAPGGLVEALAGHFDSADPLALVVAVEGTRSSAQGWKSGFYRIAVAADVPVILGYVDTRDRTCGLDRGYELTGDVSADMDVMRQFYVGRTGLRAGLESRPRLSAEDRRAD